MATSTIADAEPGVTAHGLPEVKTTTRSISGVVYIDGAWFSAEEAKLSVFDHGLLYGDGVFEGIRFYAGRVFKLDAHVDRMYRSARRIGLEPPITASEFRDLVLETCARSALSDGYIRPLFTRGIGDLGLDPRRASRPSVVIICSTMRSFGPRERTGIRAIVSTHRKIPPVCFPATIKSLNYLTSVLAKDEANARQADEAIMLDTDGFVAEATGENIFAVKDGRSVTPPTSSALEGITRETMFELLRERSPCSVRRIRPSFLKRADEVFLTGTGAGVLPVVQLDDSIIGEGKPGPVTRAVQREYRHLLLTTGTPIPAGPLEPAP